MDWVCVQGRKVCQSFKQGPMSAFLCLLFHHYNMLKTFLWSSIRYGLSVKIKKLRSPLCFVFKVFVAGRLSLPLSPPPALYRCQASVIAERLESGCQKEFRSTELLCRKVKQQISVLVEAMGGREISGDFWSLKGGWALMEHSPGTSRHLGLCLQGSEMS